MTSLSAAQILHEASLIKKEVLHPTSNTMFRDSVMREQMAHCEHINPIQVFGPFIIQGSLTVLFGHAKIGKSIIMLQIALSIARGKGHGMPCNVDKAKVIYIDLENKDRTQAKRTEGYDWPNDNVIRCQVSKDYEGSMRSELASAIEQLMNKYGTTYVILDNLSWFDSEIKKDMHAETQELMKRLDLICQERQATIILGAHRPKSNKGPLGLESLAGSSEMARRCDAVVGIGKPDDDNDARYLVQVATREDKEEYNSDNVAFGCLKVVQGLLQWVPDAERNCKESILFHSGDGNAGVNKQQECLRLMLEDPDYSPEEIEDVIGTKVSPATISNARSAAKVIKAWQSNPGLTTPEIKRITGVEAERVIKTARKYLKYD